MALEQKEWKIRSIRRVDTENFQNAIIGTNWKITLVDEDGYSGSFDGATPFRVEDINPNTYTSWENLTENQVLGWIKSYVSESKGTQYFDHITGVITKQIRDTKSPIKTLTEDFLPWGVSSSFDPDELKGPSAVNP